MTATTLPSVKQQVKNWAGGRSAKDADKRETLDAKELRIIGSLGSSTFATDKAGRELKLRGPVRPHRIEEAAPDVLLVGKLVRGDDGRPRQDAYLASVVEPGTFARLAKRKSYTPRQRPPSPLDRDHELRAGVPRAPVVLGKDAETPEDIIRDAMSRTPTLIVTDGQPPLRTVADEIAFLERSGVALAASADGAHLLVTMSKALTGMASTMLAARAPLYLGHIRGAPVRCAWPHLTGTAPEAVTIAVGNSPVCADHLAGTAA